MKYLLFYFATAISSISGSANYYYECGVGTSCVSTPHIQQGQWMAELKNSKSECMDALKKHSDPTQAWCIPVNGYTNELTPY